MWIVHEIEQRAVTLDFRSSHGGEHRATRLLADGVVFANASDLTHWGERRVQAIVCEECGIEHCASGGWLVPRNAGDVAVFLPAFEDMEAGEWDRREYRPPQYVEERGAAAFERDVYARLQESCQQLPDFDRLSPLSGRELVRYLQFVAPRAALGNSPDEPVLQEGELLASSSEDRAAIVALHDALGAIAAYQAVRIEAADVATVPFYVDAGRGAIAWEPLSAEAAPRIMPMAGYVAMGVTR